MTGANAAGQFDVDRDWSPAEVAAVAGVSSSGDAGDGDGYPGLLTFMAAFIESADDARLIVEHSDRSAFTIDRWPEGGVAVAIEPGPESRVRPHSDDSLSVFLSVAGSVESEEDEAAAYEETYNVFAYGLADQYGDELVPTRIKGDSRPYAVAVRTSVRARRTFGETAP